MPERGGAASSGAGDSDLEVGRIGRPHGLAGEVMVTAVSNRAERWAAGSRLSAVLDDGSRRMLEVLSGTAVAPGRWRIRFAGLSSREQAETLRHATLFGAALEDPEALWVHRLVGSVVEDRAGATVGRITAVVANPASDLLELESGALVPLRFVVEQRDGTVVVDLPPGLLDL